MKILNYLNPFSSQNREAYSDFKKLKNPEKCKIFFATFFITLITFPSLGAGGSFAFRKLVHRYSIKKLDPHQDTTTAGKTNQVAFAVPIMSKALSPSFVPKITDAIMHLPKIDDERLALESIRNYREGSYPDYATFQLDCNGGKIEFHKDFEYFKGPVINRYDPSGIQNGSMLARIKLTPEMTKRLLPDGIKENNLLDGYITIWGDMPDRPEWDKNPKSKDAIRTHLQYQIPTLLFNGELQAGQSQEETVDLGFFVDPKKSTIIPVSHTDDSGVAVNGLCKRTYDCHDDHRTSQMGSFDLDEAFNINSFTAIAKRNNNQAIASYNIIFKDGECSQIAARAISAANNLESLLKNLELQSQKSEQPFKGELNQQISTLKSILSGE